MSEEVVEVKQGLIIYTDGGARPNPGRAGYGMHGYLYKDEKPKKGSGNPTWLLTREGYIPKSGVIQQVVGGGDDEEVGDIYAVDDDEDAAPVQKAVIQRISVPLDNVVEVTPIHYVDSFGSFPQDESNNVAELVGATAALNYAKDYNVATVDIYTDSRYTRDGLTNWVDGWKRNGWLKQDGLPPKNVEHWKAIADARDQLEARGTSVRLHWVESHEGYQGNEDADQLATIAVLHARAGITRTEVENTPPEGYWKYETGKHPFLNHPRLYFNTLAEHNRPGEYFLGNQTKEEDTVGKRISDGSYAAVFLKEPEPAIEIVRNAQIEMAQEVHSLCWIRLDQLFKANTHSQIVKYGKQALDRTNGYKLDLNTVDKQPLTKEFRPALISWRSVEAISFLVQKLTEYKNGSAEVTSTDLTAILYETVIKTSKKKGEAPTTEMLLRSEFDVGYAALGVDANYKSEAGEVKQATIIMSLGIDMLDRNALRRLESKSPTVTLLTWPDSPTSFRYATVIESEGNVGIWAGVYSNLRILT